MPHIFRLVLLWWTASWFGKPLTCTDRISSRSPSSGHQSRVPWQRRSLDTAPISLSSGRPSYGGTSHATPRQRFPYEVPANVVSPSHNTHMFYTPFAQPGRGGRGGEVVADESAFHLIAERDTWYHQASVGAILALRQHAGQVRGLRRRALRSDSRPEIPLLGEFLFNMHRHTLVAWQVDTPDSGGGQGFAMMPDDSSMSFSPLTQ